MNCFIICIHESKAKSIFFTDVCCQDLIRVQTAEFSSEGSSVTLSYNISKSVDGDDYFLWYRQHTGKPPEFLALVSGLGLNKTAENQTRFSAKLSEGKTRVDLEIYRSLPTDSAVYCCAVRPTVTESINTLY